MGFSSVLRLVVIFSGFRSIHNVLADTADDVDTCSADDETCIIPDVEACEDKHELCSFWAEEHDECDNNPRCEFRVVSLVAVR